LSVPQTAALPTGFAFFGAIRTVQSWSHSRQLESPPADESEEERTMWGSKKRLAIKT
jgi:hypothetical protein